MVKTFLQMMNMKLKPGVYAQFMGDKDPYKVLVRPPSLPAASLLPSVDWSLV
jgi:hypothetical protein